MSPKKSPHLQLAAKNRPDSLHLLINVLQKQEKVLISSSLIGGKESSFNTRSTGLRKKGKRAAVKGQKSHIQLRSRRLPTPGHCEFTSVDACFAKRKQQHWIFFCKPDSAQIETNKNAPLASAQQKALKQCFPNFLFRQHSKRGKQISRHISLMNLIILTVGSIADDSGKDVTIFLEINTFSAT